MSDFSHMMPKVLTVSFEMGKKRVNKEEPWTSWELTGDVSATLHVEVNGRRMGLELDPRSSLSLRTVFAQEAARNA